MSSYGISQRKILSVTKANESSGVHVVEALEIASRGFEASLKSTWVNVPFVF